MQRWLADYQDSAVEYAQQGYEQIQDYVRSNFNEYVEANNLTQVQLMLVRQRAGGPSCLVASCSVWFIRSIA